MNRASGSRDTGVCRIRESAGGVTIGSMHCENDIHLDPIDPTGLVGANDAAAEAVLDRIGPLDGRRLLEVGCGDGWHLVGAADRGAEVWGVDPSAALLWLARAQLAGADLRLGSADELPFDTGSFDVVCRFDCSDDDAEAAQSLAEMVRVCRRGGVVAITVVGFDAVDAYRQAAAIRRHALALGLDPRRFDPDSDELGPPTSTNERRGSVQAVILAT